MLKFSSRLKSGFRKFRCVDPLWRSPNPSNGSSVSNATLHRDTLLSWPIIGFHHPLVTPCCEEYCEGLSFCQDNHDLLAWHTKWIQLHLACRILGTVRDISPTPFKIILVIISRQIPGLHAHMHMAHTRTDVLHTGTHTPKHPRTRTHPLRHRRTHIKIRPSLIPSILTQRLELQLHVWGHSLLQADISHFNI